MPVEQSGNSNKKLKKRDRNWNLIDAGAGLWAWAWAWVYVSVCVSSFGRQKFRGRCTTQPEKRERKVQGGRQAVCWQGAIQVLTTF